MKNTLIVLIAFFSLVVRATPDVSKYLTEDEYFSKKSNTYTWSIARAQKSASYANQHVLEQAAMMEYMDNEPSTFMACKSKWILRNGCPVNVMGGLFVLYDDGNGIQVYDTFWGSQHAESAPSEEEVEARTAEIIAAIGVTNFMFNSSSKQLINTNDKIQKIRIKTTAAFYYRKLAERSKNGIPAAASVYQAVYQAAKTNHMDADRYVNQQEITDLLNSKGMILK